MEFVNNTGQDVYIDIGNLKLVKPGEVIKLEGAYTCPPLTPVPFEKKPARKSPPKTKKKPSK